MTDKNLTDPDDVTHGPGEPSSPEVSLLENIGAYLLDALPADERATFEAFLATSPEAQEELRQLAPVVALLPSLLDVDHTGAQLERATSENLRTRVMSEIATSESAPAATAEAAAVPPAIPIGASRTRNRARAHIDPAAPRQRSRPLASVPMAWLSAAVAVIAIGSIFWALALQGRIDSKNREITAQQAQIAELRQNSNASAFQLAATDVGTADSAGTLLFSLKDQIGVLYVRHLPNLDDAHVYQVWYLDKDSTVPIPGETFSVDGSGNGFTLVSSETTQHDGIALTAEPDGGSVAPTTAPIMSGALTGAAG